MTKFITFPGDIFIPPLEIWLDPGHVKDFAFVSHAHADHSGRHKSIVASLPTAQMLNLRLQVDVDHVLDYGERISLGKGHMTLYPSGHILGAAQALIEWEGKRLVYTGDFKLKPSRTAEPCQILECDHLVMECTYGKPHYKFPDRNQVESELLAHIENVFQRDEVPLIFAYVLGRSQDILKLLLENGFSVAAENRIFEMTEMYETLGISIGSFERFNPEDYQGRVLVFPPHLWKSPVVTNIQKRHTMAVTGWAVDGRQKAWYGSDTAFPLSDHADFNDLIRYVEVAQPKEVTLIHGFPEFGDHIRRMGIETQIVTGKMG